MTKCLPAVLCSLILSTCIATVAAAQATVQPPSAAKVAGQPGPPKDFKDNRDNLSLLAYGGLGTDTFTPADNAFYVQGSDQTQNRVRGIAGFDFAYRLTSKNSPVQFWLSGATLYGVASAEEAVPSTVDPDKFFRTVIQATSLEAYLAPRFEFWTLNKDDTPVAVYATAHLGLMALKGTPQIARADHVGVGGIVMDGVFERSLLEFGWGRSTQFVDATNESKWDRFKIDAVAAVAIKKVKGLSAFFRFRLDMPLTGDDKASAIQTFLGAQLELSKLVNKK